VSSVHIHILWPLERAFFFHGDAKAVRLSANDMNHQLHITNTFWLSICLSGRILGLICRSATIRSKRAKVNVTWVRGNIRESHNMDMRLQNVEMQRQIVLLRVFERGPR